MSKQIVTKKETAVMPVSMFSTEELGGFAIDSQDLLMPSLLLMQGQSQIVADGKAAIGDIVNSVTFKVLGNKTKPFSFIPLDYKKFYLKMDASGPKPVRLEKIPFKPEHASLPYENVIDGKKIRHAASFDFYVLCEEDLNAGFGMPCCLSFKGMSRQTGKKLLNNFTELIQKKMHPSSYTFELVSEQRRNDSGPFQIFEIKGFHETNPDFRDIIKNWLGVIHNSAYTVDEKEVEAETSAVPF